ncbi:MAG: flagellar biosynthesis regulator FlaF [Pseudomonadota bacterium]
MDAALAAQGYAKASQSTADPRAVEYQTFARVNNMLAKAKNAGPSEFNKIVDAVYKNNQLWDILAADIANQANPLPDDLKIGIIKLYAFSRNHGRNVLKKKATVDALIEVNSNIMKGLRSAATKPAQKKSEAT